MVKNSVLVIRPTSHSCLSDGGGYLKIFGGTHSEDKINTKKSVREGDLMHSERRSVRTELGEKQVQPDITTQGQSSLEFPTQHHQRLETYTVIHMNHFPLPEKKKKKDLESKAKRRCVLGVLSALFKT